MSGPVKDTERDRESAELRRELAHLQRRARENERIWSGFRGIEVRMIGAESLADVIAVLTTDLPALFPAVQHVSLACVDPQFECARMLAEAPVHATQGFVPIDDESLTDWVGAPPHPRLGSIPDEMCRRLFPSSRGAIGSVAIAPLVLRGKLIGTLNQGSADATHFNSAAATDLLQHLAAVTAMCVDSALNRERLKQDGLTDALTAIPNRRFFERRLREELERWRRSGRPLACVLADVDHFKQINDRFGHAAGDRALQSVADGLGRGLRTSDVLARFGGEEFALLLPDTAGERALAIAERLRDSVARLPFPVADESVPLTVSIGLACLPAHRGEARGVAPADVLDCADAAMYGAKAAGRNRVVSASLALPD